MKKILEEISSTHIFTGFENAAFFPWYVAPEKRAGISNFVKNRVLKSSSNIFFTLVKLWLTKRRSFIPLSFLIYAYYHIDEIFFRNSLLYTSFYEIRLIQLKGTQWPSTFDTGSGSWNFCQISKLPEQNFHRYFGL